MYPGPPTRRSQCLSALHNSCELRHKYCQARIHYDILRSKKRLLVGILGPSLIEGAPVLGPDAMLALSPSLWALSCLCPGSPGRIPGLKGVTNFFADTLRVGVPLMGIGEENPDPEPEYAFKAMALDPLVGVKATELKRDGVCCEFSEILVAEGLRRGDLKGFVKAFTAVPKVDGAWNGRLLGAPGVEKCAADRKVPSPPAWPRLGRSTTL